MKQAARTVLLLQTHYLNRPVLKLFANLRRAMPHYDARVLMHLPPGAPKPAALASVPHHFVTTPEIRNSAYINKVNGENWGIWRGGHTDLIALHFFNANPDFDHYWFIEYDVRFSGSWTDLFAHFERSRADFLGTTVRRASVHPDWMHWPSLRVPDGQQPLPEHELIGSFMPIMRVSRAALRAIDAAYRAGWSGHCEVTWPTIVHAAGLEIEDIGGKGEFVRPQNVNRFYTNTPLDEDHAPGSMVFRPARSRVGGRRNMLWHPVKPLPHKLREDARHFWVLLKPYLRWVLPGDARHQT